MCVCVLSFSHIMEHLDGVIDKPEKEMTPQELQLHYFKMHDYDGNNLLDGLELAAAITHVHKEVGPPTGEGGGGGPVAVTGINLLLTVTRREERTASP